MVSPAELKKYCDGKRLELLGKERYYSNSPSSLWISDNYHSIEGGSIFKPLAALFKKARRSPPKFLPMNKRESAVRKALSGIEDYIALIPHSAACLNEVAWLMISKSLCVTALAVS